MNNDTTTKLTYQAPTLRVVEFEVERGFADSNLRLFSFTGKMGNNPPSGGGEPYGGDNGKNGFHTWDGWGRYGSGNGNGNSYF